MKASHWLRWLFACLSVVLLAGCGASGEEDLRAWMAEQRRQTPPKVKPIPEPKAFRPESYARDGSTDPFSRDKLNQALKQAGIPRINGLIAPELQRRREPLEAYPLDSMMMVGSVVKDGKTMALVKIDKLLYQVRVGAYLGQNYGKVLRITETELSVREVVQDAVGEWVERSATLQLQEGKK